MSFAHAIRLTHGEQVLIERCLQNDASAFDEVVSRYKTRVYNYVYRMIGDEQEAEDLTQEVFIRMYTSLPRFRNQSTLNTWLFRIASNLCIDRFRRNRKHQAVAFSLDEISENGDSSQREVADTRFEPSRMADSSEMSGKIEDALLSLPEKLRAVALLYDVEGLAYEEIAAIVGCPLGTVKSRLFNARARMRAKLTPYLKNG
jgi:RNA polymerase sigma-70 factor (ECF subfamily)